MSDEYISLPPELTMAIVDSIAQANPTLDGIEAVVIAVRQNTPPTVMSTITPDAVKGLLEWLLERHGEAGFEIHERIGDSAPVKHTRQ